METSERQIKKEIISYGLVSIKEIEYVGNSLDTSFILFDASAVQEKSNETGTPQVEQSKLNENVDLEKQGRELLDGM